MSKTDRSSGAARQARQRAKGRQVAVILPPPAAEALDAIRQQLGCTQAQAIARSLIAMRHYNEWSEWVHDGDSYITRCMDPKFAAEAMVRELPGDPAEWNWQWVVTVDGAEIARGTGYEKIDAQLSAMRHARRATTAATP